MPTCPAHRETLQPSSCLSEWLGRVQFEVLFWSSLGVVYDSDIGRFQGHRTSPAPPSPSLAPLFTMFAPARILISFRECAAVTVEPHPKKNSLGSTTF